MPLYICNAAKGAIDDAAKPKIAADITRVHCEVTGAPPQLSTHSSPRSHPPNRLAQPHSRRTHGRAESPDCLRDAEIGRGTCRHLAGQP